MSQRDIGEVLPCNGRVENRKRGLVSLCLKNLQPPRLAATPPIFYIRKTQREKKLPYPTKNVLPPHVVVTPRVWGGNTLPYYIPRLTLMVAI